jgi:hypothetical protein
LYGSSPLLSPEFDDTRGYGNITFALSGNTLPAGLTFITSNGAITGNSTLVLDETVYTITANDGQGQTSTANINLIVTDVNPTYAMNFQAHIGAGGVTQGIKLPTSATLDFGSGDFTIEFYAKANAYGIIVFTNLGLRGETITSSNTDPNAKVYDFSAYAPVIFDANTTVHNGVSLSIEPRYRIPSTWLGNQRVIFRPQPSTTSIANSYISFNEGDDTILDLHESSYTDFIGVQSNMEPMDNYPAQLVEPVWRHIAYVRSGSSIYLYIDGRLSGTASASSVTTATLSGGQIGRSYDATETKFNGLLSNFRVTKSAVYAAGFVPPTVPLQPITNTVLLLNGSTITDNSNNNLTLTEFDSFPPIKTVHILPKRPKNNGLQFTRASSQFLTLPNSTELDFGSGDFTIEFYVRNQRSTSQSANSMIVDAGTSSQFTGIGVGTANTGSINFISFRAQSGYTVLKATTPVNTSEAQFPEPGTARDVFQHVACVKFGSNGYLFINGILEDSTTSWSGVTSASIKSGYIGRNRSSSTNQYFNGVISNFRVTKTALYTSNFTVNPQTSEDDTSPYYVYNWLKNLSDKPYIPVANTVLLLNGNSINNLDNSNNRFTFTTAGTDPVLRSRNNWQNFGPTSVGFASGWALSNNWDTLYYPHDDNLPLFSY